MALNQLLDASRGKIPADIVFVNAKVINVYTGLIQETSIAVTNGIIVGLGDYQGTTTVDLLGAYVAPGLIDGHVHIESSMLVPHEFARIVLPKGTTTVVADPHEIANVCGVNGVEYMIEDAKATPLSVYFMIPSCVPATPFETAGARISVDDVLYLKQKNNVLGLGEVMDYPAVLSGSHDVHAKIKAMANRPIDGHSPGLDGKELNAYRLSGIETDHEPSSIKELEDRVERGMYVHLREGSQTRNVVDLLPGVTEDNRRWLLFCTDDKHPEDILREGHINYNVNLAIRHGMNPIHALQIATINAATCYGLKQKGAIAPGKDADFIVFNSLREILPKAVYVQGILVAKDGAPTFHPQAIDSSSVQNTVHVDLGHSNLRLPLKQSKIHVIGLVPNNVTTTDLILDVNVAKGIFEPSGAQDVLKLAVFERHTNSGRVGLGLVHGYGLKNGAVAMSIAHDSHNLIAIGSSDGAILAAAKAVQAMQGGIALVEGETLVGSLRLEIGGIMTEQSGETVAATLRSMATRLRMMGVNAEIVDPFLQLAFLALPVIPDLKLTDFGLFDVRKFSWIPLEVGEQ
jgi:adenine deaminase